MELILLLLRLLLAAILGLAGIGKLMDPAGGKTVMSDFGIPKALAKPAAIALSLFEIILAAGLLFINTSWAAATATFLLMLLFIVGMLWQIARGRTPECHCFGQLHSEPVSGKSVARNVVFAIPALALSVSGPSHQGFSFGDPAVDSAQNLFGLLAVAMFGAILLYLRRISSQQQTILRRIDLLELLSTEGGAVERNEAGAPQDSLPIGAFFPEFILPDVNGSPVGLADLLTGRPVVFLFVDSNCIPCTVLQPELEDWEAELQNVVEFVYISSGSTGDNQHKFGSGKKLLLQKDKELGERVFAKWTPSAILVNAQGRIASHVAIGDTSIRKLITEIKETNFNDQFSHIPLTNGDSFIPRKIGQTLPEFALKDVSGNEITAVDLSNKRTLVTFWSPTCPHCEALMEEIKVWDKNGLPDDLNLVIFSDGDLNEHQELNLRSPIVLDKGYKISAQLGVWGTPSAVLIDETGHFVSETAIGGPNIWSLIRRDKVS